MAAKIELTCVVGFLDCTPPTETAPSKPSNITPARSSNPKKVCTIASNSIFLRSIRDKTLVARTIVVKRSRAAKLVTVIDFQFNYLLLFSF